MSGRAGVGLGLGRDLESCTTVRLIPHCPAQVAFPPPTSRPSAARPPLVHALTMAQTQALDKYQKLNKLGEGAQACLNHMWRKG